MTNRLDIILVEKGFAKSRERAKELIKSNGVLVDGKVINKPSAVCDELQEIKIVGETFEYVGRGALKLKHAFDCFDLNIYGKCCADIGASTGGFTQIMLENGAKCVYAVDVGHDQLDDKLLNDNRVINCEGVNVKNLTYDFFSEPVEFMAGDLSFISLKQVVPVLKECIADKGEMVLLIKPQFEAGKKALNKKGIVKDKKDHIRVLQELLPFFEDCKFEILGLEGSGIKGGDGNIEYIVWLKKSDEPNKFLIDIKKFVDTVFVG